MEAMFDGGLDVLGRDVSRHHVDGLLQIYVLLSVGKTIKEEKLTREKGVITRIDDVTIFVDQHLFAPPPLVSLKSCLLYVYENVIKLCGMHACLIFATSLRTT